ncbi:hypothetical protein K435DRAFT_874914 [Dendrothele bispora CBS 962.96]|uniref:Uncharacterized protein n=1 Tax=Dendrothele bispora (strain CBS 962.96) TaxID=1314807 RepID=A0A4S8KVI8_DENBC|nr:hypothetical protein K435DRAFT_874914 [Dendrothele bispora CBS 962.96]
MRQSKTKFSKAKGQLHQLFGGSKQSKNDTPATSTDNLSQDNPSTVAEDNNIPPVEGNTDNLPQNNSSTLTQVQQNRILPLGTTLHSVKQSIPSVDTSPENTESQNKNMSNQARPEIHVFEQASYTKMKNSTMNIARRDLIQNYYYSRHF